MAALATGAGIGASLATFGRPAEPPNVAAIAAVEPPAVAAPAPSQPPLLAPAWQRHAAAAPPNDGRPRIALVIDDVGVHIPNARRALALPGPVTLSLMTYAPGLAGLAEAGRQRGHELLLHVPMEPEGWDVDPGPNVLLADVPRYELRRRVAWALDRVDGVVGINNHMGSRFTADRAAMDFVMAELARRGLMFLDSVTSGRTVGSAASRAAGVPYVARDVFLDNVETAEAIRAQLRKLEAVARRDGSAIAIAHPKAVTLDVLEAWLASLAQRGFVLVPVSALVAAPNGDLVARAGR
jgi:polysaccharide deacetylase 2 family uncharacterized protein YibQ